MAEAQRVEIGFEGGQVDLRQAHRRRAEGPAQAGREGRLARPEDRGRRPLRLPRQGLLPPHRLRRAPGRLLARPHGTDARPHSCSPPSLWRRWARRSGGARTRRPVPTASASGSKRRTRSSPASGCARCCAPQPGERLLEIGPGVGYYTLDMAEWVGPEGKVEIFDLQREFLDHTIARAAERGLENVVPTQGDATALSYEDASVDAVVLTAVLGEIPDPVAALREIGRVLKPGGRLVVGELFGDPHFTTLAALKRQAAEAGLDYAEHSGNWFAYFARLTAGLAESPPLPRG